MAKDEMTPRGMIVFYSVVVVLLALGILHAGYSAYKRGRDVFHEVCAEQLGSYNPNDPVQVKKMKELQKQHKFLFLWSYPAP